MGIFSALLVLCEGNSSVTCEFPSQRPVTQSFDVFFELCLNKRLSKLSTRRWFETPSRSLWHHCNEPMFIRYHRHPTRCNFTENGHSMLIKLSFKIKFVKILCICQGQWFHGKRRHGEVQSHFNTLRRQNGRHFADDIFKWIFLNENVWISIKISLKFVPQGFSINNILALVQIMAWRRSGDKPLSGPMLFRLPTRICVTRPQWVNTAQLGPNTHQSLNRSER